MTDETKGLGPLRRALRQGEWACVDAKCAYINGEKRHSCEACGKSKPRAKSRVGREIGKDAAEKSKGLFSADDWVCTKCGNVNWARRSVCNICNAPKLGDLEVRTGYGGGYMDREDVEYIERDDDEEFDEFGRKKKKRNKEERLNANIHHVELKSESLTASKDTVENLNLESEKEDDEEEEDSDDADLDKYDLTADPDLLNFRIEAKANFSEMHSDRPGSAMSSNCSCSCSGGECSCVESDTESLRSKKAEKEESSFRRRGSSRDYDRHRDRSRERDRWGGAPGRRSSRDDRDGARRSKDFERSSRRSSRSRERSRDKDRSYR